MRLPSKRTVSDAHRSSCLLESGNHKSRVIPCIPRHRRNSDFSNSVQMDGFRKCMPMSTENNSAHNKQMHHWSDFRSQNKTAHAIFYGLRQLTNKNKTRVRKNFVMIKYKRDNTNKFYD